MPYTPYNTKCAMLGCKNPKSKLNSYCMEHGGREYSNNQDGAYDSKLWKTTRKRQLSLQPLCQACLCQGIITAAQHVDHVFPWRQIGEHAFTRNIFQSLCHNCHSQKSGLEKQGIYRHYAQEGVKDYSRHDYAYMLHQYNTEPQN